MLQMRYLEQSLSHGWVLLLWPIIITVVVVVVVVMLTDAHNHCKLQAHLMTPLWSHSWPYRTRIPTQASYSTSKNSFLPTQLLWDRHPKLGIWD